MVLEAVKGMVGVVSGGCLVAEMVVVVLLVAAVMTREKEERNRREKMYSNHSVEMKLRQT